MRGALLNDSRSGWDEQVGNRDVGPRLAPRNAVSSSLKACESAKSRRARTSSWRFAVDGTLVGRRHKQVESAVPALRTSDAHHLEDTPKLGRWRIAGVRGFLDHGIQRAM